MFLCVFYLLLSPFTTCRSDITCACLGMTLGMRGGQRARPRCAEHVPHQHRLLDLYQDLLPFAAILLRLVSPLVARVKHVQVPFLPSPHIAEGQFLSKSKPLSFLKPRNLVEMSGEPAMCGSF